MVREGCLLYTRVAITVVEVRVNHQLQQTGVAEEEAMGFNSELVFGAHLSFGYRQYIIGGTSKLVLVPLALQIGAHILLYI
jgi:hypothetical protein